MSDRTKPDITIEKAGTDEESFCDVFALLLELHKAGGYAPLDVEKASANCYRVLTEGMTFLARDEETGKPVGTLALTELAFWYSPQTFLQDAWVYVSPEYRKGKVGVALMRAARDEGRDRDKIVFVTVNNPDRRQKKTAMSLESQIAGFVPLGYTIKLR